MRLTINNLNHKYNLSFGEITQLCGSNIPGKSFIIDSIAKHFSSEKYKEYEEKYIDNIQIDGEVPGRKQWECIRLNSRESFISAIQMNKGSILGKCLKECTAQFDCQNQLMQIDDILTMIFDNLNKELFSNDLIELQYVPEDLFTMIQQTSVKTKDGNDIHELEINDLIDILIEIMKKQQDLIPEKRLYIFENVDHLISKEMFQSLVKECIELSRNSNIWFIFTTSFPEYVYVDDEFLEYVNIINDEVFIMPNMEHITEFIKMNYPIEKEWDFDALKMMIAELIQYIGKNNAILNPDMQVLLKLINDSIGVKSQWDYAIKSPEIQCLLG